MWLECGGNAGGTGSVSPREARPVARRLLRQRPGRLLRRQGDAVASLYEIVAGGTHEFFAAQKRGARLRRAADPQLGLGL